MCPFSEPKVLKHCSCNLRNISFYYFYMPDLLLLADRFSDYVPFCLLIDWSLSFIAILSFLWVTNIFEGCQTTWEHMIELAWIYLCMFLVNLMFGNIVHTLHEIYLSYYFYMIALFFKLSREWWGLWLFPAFLNWFLLID